MKETGTAKTTRKVLMVSYNYPPVGAIGSLRTTKLAKYLPSWGWMPTVLSVAGERTKWGGGDPSEGVFPGVKVIRAPFPDVLTAVQNLLASFGLITPGRGGEETRLLAEAETPDGIPGTAVQRAFRWVKRWLAFPDRYLLWVPFAVWRGMRELKSDRYDAIYSTSPPVTDHIVAAVLQRLSGLPWLADYRDPWTNNALRGFTEYQRYLHGKLEKAVMKRAETLVAATPPWARELEAFFGRAKNVLCITNGYDPDDFPGEVDVLPGRFLVTYTGTVHWLDGDESLRQVIEVFEQVASEKNLGGKVVLRFFGPHQRTLNKLKESMGNPRVLEVNGVVPRKEALERQRESTALLLVMKDSPYAAKLHTGKVFEYLGARRPILVWAPAGGIVIDLLNETGAGVAVSTREELRAVLEDWLEQFSDTGTVSFGGDEEAIDGYGWDRLSGDMAEALTGIMSSG